MCALRGNADFIFKQAGVVVHGGGLQLRREHASDSALRPERSGRWDARGGGRGACRDVLSRQEAHRGGAGHRLAAARLFRRIRDDAVRDARRKALPVRGHVHPGRGRCGGVPCVHGTVGEDVRREDTGHCGEVEEIMIYVLLLYLVIIDILFFILFDRNILSPSVIGTGMFMVSTLFAVLNVDNWKFTISPLTVLVICLSLLFLGAGEFFVHFCNYRHNQFRKIHYGQDNAEIKIGNGSILLIVAIFGILLVNYYRETVKLAVQAGYKSNNGMLMLAYARTASLNKHRNYEGIGRLAAYSYTFMQVIAYIFSYIFLYNKIIAEKRHCAKYLFPVFLLIPYIILSTGRTSFIYLIMVWIVVGSCFYMQKKCWNPKYVFKIIGVGLGGMMLFLLLFILAGSFKSKTIMENAWKTISFYAGLSIPSLDWYFTAFNPPESEYFGEHVFFGIYGILNRINPSIPDFYAPWFEFATFNHTKGNVYTIIRRYHQDFGYFGLFFMMFCLGAFYSFFFLRLNNTRKNAGLLVYAFIFSPIVEISIEERFFMNVITLKTAQMIVLSYIMFQVFINNYGKKIAVYLFKIDMTDTERRLCHE